MTAERVQRNTTSQGPPMSPPPQAPRKWRPTPFIQASAMTHLAGALALALKPEFWPWVGAVLASNQLALVGAGLWPRSNWLGPNIVRLPQAAAARGEVALTFDDGPDPAVTPRVLDVLDRYGAKASFFCVGARAEAFPEIIKEIVHRGHSIENHTFRHPNSFACYLPAGLRREIEHAQSILARIAGRAPEFFRAPAGLRSPLLEPILASTGLRYAAWTRRGYDAVDGEPARVGRRLAANLAAGDVLLLHDAGSARTRAGAPVVLAVLPALLDQLAAKGLKSLPLPNACDARPQH